MMKVRLYAKQINGLIERMSYAIGNEVKYSRYLMIYIEQVLNVYVHEINGRK